MICKTACKASRKVFSRILLKRTIIITATGAALLLGSKGHAQEAKSEGYIIEEIVITAQKREQVLTEAPLAVSAFSQRQIDKAGMNTPDVLADIVPNVFVGNGINRDSVFISIRGVSGTQSTNSTDPTTAFHVDGGYVTRLSGANGYFYDLERVEVLRGPQGTLYGRNSTAGVVNVISRKPTQEWEAYLEADFGNYDATLFSGALNVPVIEDKLAVRAAFNFNERDGYTDNRLPERGDDADDFAARLHALATPTENLSILLTGEIYRKNGVGATRAFLDFPGNSRPELAAPGPRNAPLNTLGFRDNGDDAFRTEISYDFGNFNLTYLGSFRSHERHALMDLDATDVFSAFLEEVMESDAWTHELRLTSTHDSAFQWIAGGFMLDEEIDSVFEIYIPSNLFGGKRQFQFVDRDQSNESIAVFFDGSYDISDRLQLLGGIRYTEDDKERGNSDQINLSPVTPPLSQNQAATFDKTTWRAGLAYDISDDLNAYATVTTGFKSGGLNRGAVVDVFGPEDVTAYEGGVKGSLADGRAQISVAAFYYDYSGLQQSQNTQTVDRNGNPTVQNITVNAASATVKGLEVELALVPWERGMLNASLGLLDAEFGAFTGVVNPFSNEVEDLSGNNMVQAPDMTFNIILEPYVFSIAGGTLTPRVQFHYESGADLLIQNLGLRDSFTKTDLSLLYESERNGWYGQVYVRNLEDEDVISAVSTGTAFIAPTQRALSANYAAPRTYGIKAGFRF